MIFTNTLVLAFAATATAAPQFTWPWGGGSTGGSTTGGTSSTSNTANDVTKKAACQPITLIFARGTSETGNIGSVVGPPLRTSLQKKFNNKVNFQGVPYPASVQGNANGGDNGGSLMVSLAQQALQQCPDTKVVLSGYSQGGSVVHKAGTLLTASTPIAAAVIFGDPANGSPVANVKNLKEYCASGDKVCEAPKTYAITPAHTTYGRNGNTDDAANYIAGVTGVV
ncbi:MAG: hypothetical protein Q9168_005485 [Polycauliona sp. 1 TL-2023]